MSAIALGALVAVTLDPRATFLVAGLGVLVIALIAAAVLGTNWLQSREKTSPDALDAEGEIMVELIPVGESPVRPV